MTITINVGYGAINTSPVAAGELAENTASFTTVSYATLRGDLQANATTATDASAVATLPATAPVSGKFQVTTAEAKALGVISSASQAVDGYIGFSSALAYTYNDASGVAAGTFDFNGVALHEMTEVMGRLLLTGTNVNGVLNSYDALDLFHYSAPGTRDFSADSGYLSANGGATDSGDFNTVSPGDPGDWSSSMGNDSFDAFANPGVALPFSTDDLTAMNVLGWDPASAAPPPSPPPPPPPTAPPTGVAITAATQSLGQLQSSSGLATGRAIANLTEVGGASGDSFSYSLGGANASSFALTTSGNVGTLSTAGKSGLPGAANGKLYALTVTAKDTTANVSSPAAPLDVVVGSSGADTINLATLAGAVSAATPTFVYGLAGNDHISGAGMASSLWFVGGSGGDTLTGGSGVNHYLYGAAGDSGSSAMDDITNFHVATDVIDLTRLGIALTYVGQITATQLSAHTVGWQVSGGNTFIYADTGGSSQKLTNASMKIELTGSVTLTSSDILHH